jgi:two-component system, OmpR family, response regulator
LEQGEESMNICVVEDDTGIAEFLKKGLREAGFAVDHVTSAEEGYDLLLHRRYDAAVIDIMLPGMDGLTLIERLRSKGNQTPILILSAKRDVDDRVSGFRSGGDDYLVKPFSFAELMARIQALIRRSTRSSSPTRFQAGDLTLDLVSHQVIRGESKIELQPREFALLEYLIRNKGQVLSKTMIMEHVWDYSFDPQTNVVDVLVSRLRSKIDKGFDRKLIHTVRGVGYVLKTEE